MARGMSRRIAALNFMMLYKVVDDIFGEECFAVRMNWILVGEE
jgi:uncharacterized membrane protein YuzA (DUF378 family)